MASARMSPAATTHELAKTHAGGQIVSALLDAGIMLAELSIVTLELRCPAAHLLGRQGDCGIAS